jgi:ankyrin repeat protein
LAGLENHIQNGLSLDATIRLRTLAYEEFLTRGPTLMCVASFFGSSNCFRYLLGNGAVWDVADDFGRNVTHFACAGGCLEILSLLSQHGVDWLTRDVEGNSCVHYAIMFHHPDVVFWLWAGYQMDLGILNSRKMSALHFAVLSSEASVIDFLVQSGCDVNAKNDQGLTPVHMAASRPNLKVLNKLLAYGADLTLRDNRGCLPYHCAVLMHHQHVQRLLLDSCPTLDFLSCKTG